MARDRLFTFRGIDHTLITDADGNWSLYVFGSNDPVEDLTPEEEQQINDIIHDGYSDEVDLER